MSINVCGIGVVSAIGVGCDENFDSLLSQRCGITESTLFDSSINVPMGVVKLSNEELKESLGIDSSRTISRTALLGALAAKEALAEIDIAKGKRVGLINSTTVGGMDLSEDFYRGFMKDSSKGRLRDVVGHDCATSSEFIAEVCGITSFVTTISTACSSAANAVIMGARMLERGMLDYVLVGGVDSLCRFTLCGFSSLMILDEELCRPFDQNRKGLNLGEGAGYLLLTKEQPTPKSLCRLAGYANANDAYHQTASSAEGEGAYRAMSEAISVAGIDCCEIDYINLHGTGTSNNDLSESAAIKRVFEGKRIPSCSSTKSYTGHTLAASGGVEAVFSVLALTHNVIYSSLRVISPINDDMPIATHVQEGVKLNYILSSSFGFGGNCSSLIFGRG